MLKSYLFQPVLWGVVVLFALKLPAHRFTGKLGIRSSLFYLALMIGFAQVCFYMTGGLFSSLGKNPLSFTPLYIFLNLLLVASTLAGMELSRAWLVRHSGRHTFLATGCIALLYGLLTLALSRLLGMKADLATMNFAAATLLPALAESLLATVLAFIAGARASLAYRAVLAVFWWFCPVIPDLTWSLKGLIGVITPVAGLAVVWNFYHAKTQPSRIKRSSGGMPVGWILTAVTGVAFIWFSVGIFPVHPVLILTGSMRPSIEPGDVAIIAKIPVKNIRVGDVIEYRHAPKVNVVHRLIEIDDNQGQKLFITRGDANDAADEPFLAVNTVGKVVFNVPKIGWAANAVKQFLP